MSDVTLVFNDKMQELLNKALNDGLTYREGAFMQIEIQKQLATKVVAPTRPRQIMPVVSVK